MGIFENLKKCFNLGTKRAGSQRLRQGVRAAYSAVADNPKDKHPFPVGRKFAESIGYSKSLLDSLPPATSESFTGLSNVSIFAEIPEGAIVVDLGCGTGVDTMIAAHKTGATGRVLGVDFSLNMLKKARLAIQGPENKHINLHCADAERLPLQDNSVDIVMANGIFNLNPARTQIINEIYRILKPGGKLFGAEMVFKKTQRRRKVTNLSQWMS